LEAVTEELEDSSEILKNTREIFDGMTFVDKKTLGDIGALDLLGSNSLKPHMHGFFINSKLYKELRSKTIGELELDTVKTKKDKLKEK